MPSSNDFVPLPDGGSAVTVPLTDGLPGLAEPLENDHCRDLGYDGAAWGGRPVCSTPAGSSTVPPEAAPRVFVCGPCGSSLDVAWGLDEAGLLRPWDAVLAHSQRRGRGRGGHGWHSAPGNLYAAFPLPSTMKDVPVSASILTGFVVREAASALYVPLWLKWPNDILAHGDHGLVKVGGLLLEGRRGRLMAGLGLNLREAPKLSGAALPAGVFPVSGLTPFDIWRRMLPLMRRTVDRLAALDPEDILETIERALVWRGKLVRVEMEGESASGHFLGLARRGGLFLGTAEGERREIFSGSLFLEEYDASN